MLATYWIPWAADTRRTLHRLFTVDAALLERLQGGLVSVVSSSWGRIDISAVD